MYFTVYYKDYLTAKSVWCFRKEELQKKKALMKFSMPAPPYVR